MKDEDRRDEKGERKTGEKITTTITLDKHVLSDVYHTIKHPYVWTASGCNGSKVNGTRYNKAGCAALNTSDDTVAVNSPKKYPISEQ
ncbi:hypothetical protein V9T40_006447 [Parthenolecanium corni]|uniref:Uncharacterized protein n=1 Tax=Parthenolecanium corni TaxID=536013 RepID=A0AAN9TM96_9HEMI